MHYKFANTIEKPNGKFILLLGESSESSESKVATL